MPTALVKRDEESSAILEAVAAVYPEKGDTATVTGSTPATRSRSAEQLDAPGVYTSASSPAIAQRIRRVRVRPHYSVLSTTGTFAAVTSTSIPSSTTPASTVGHVRRAISTLPIFAGCDSSETSSGCSRIISTVTPTVTVRAQATEVTYNNCFQHPTMCQNGSPPRVIEGDKASCSI